MELSDAERHPSVLVRRVDDLRRQDPKFQMPRFQHYLNAVAALDEFARANYCKRVIHLALRWVLDRAGAPAIPINGYGRSIVYFGARPLEGNRSIKQWMYGD